MRFILLPSTLPVVNASLQAIARVVPYLIPETTDITALIGFTWDVYTRGLIPKLISMALSRVEFQAKLTEHIRNAYQKYVTTKGVRCVSGSSLDAVYSRLRLFYYKSLKLEKTKFDDKNFADMNTAINKIYNEMSEETGGISSGEWVVVEYSDFAKL